MLATAASCSAVTPTSSRRTLDSVPAPAHRAVPPDERVEMLTRRLTEGAEQQAATSQVLEVIGRSVFELQPVFETVLRHAVRLCNADAGLVYQTDGDVYRLAFVLGGSDEYQEFAARNPIGQGPGTLVGRAALERQPVQIADVLADPNYEWHEGQRLGGYRTLLGVPMLAGDRVLGVITLGREAVDPFDDRTIKLVTTFAAQGAIAIRNVHLFRELQALGEIGQAITSSLDLDEVLTTIVTRAVQLSGTEGGSIFEFDPATSEFHVRTCYGTADELVKALQATRIHLDETFVGRAAASGEPQQPADLELVPSDPHIDELRRAGWRSLVAIPLLREQEILGALIVRGQVPGAVSEHTVALLETLASQSAVAIHNARVFRELEVK